MPPRNLQPQGVGPTAWDAARRWTERLRRAAGSATYAAAFACAAAVLLPLGLTDFRSLHLKGKAPVYGDDGEPLHHGVAGDRVTYSMPLYLTSVKAVEHGPPRLRGPAFAAFGAGLLALLLCLGRAFHSWRAGALSAAVALFLSRRWDLDGIHRTELGGSAEQAYFLWTLLLCALLLVLRSRRRTSAGAVLLGSALGASLLVRSSLALFPPVLGALEWRALKGRPFRRRLLQALSVGALPYLFLLPWIRLNAVLHGRFVPFENGRLDANIITSALGLVPNIEGDARALAGLAPDQAALPWAIGEILRHPLRYLLSVADRWVFAAGFEPALVGLGLLGFWAGRKRPETAALGLLCAYFFGVHCMVSIEPRYLLPLWPLLALASVSPAAGPPSEEGPGRRLALAAAPAFLAPLLAFSGVAWTKTLAYPSHSLQEDGGLVREIDRHREEPWLLAARGESRLRSGLRADAADDLVRAHRLDPTPMRELEMAWGLWARGREGWDYAESMKEERSSELADGLRILTGFIAAEKGDLDAARRRLEGFRAGRTKIRRMARPSEREAGDRLRELEGDPRSSGSAQLFRLLQAAEPGRRFALLARLEELRPAHYAEAWAALAEDAVSAGSPELAARALEAGAERLCAPSSERAPGLAESAEERFLSVPLGLEGSGRGEGARTLYDALLLGCPDRARYLNARGAFWARLGRGERSEKDLQAAIAADPAFLQPYLTLFTLRSRAGLDAEAALACERGLRAHGGRPPTPESRLLALELSRLRAGALP